MTQQTTYRGYRITPRPQESQVGWMADTIATDGLPTLSGVALGDSLAGAVDEMKRLIDCKLSEGLPELDALCRKVAETGPYQIIPFANINTVEGDGIGKALARDVPVWVPGIFLAGLIRECLHSRTGKFEALGDPWFSEQLRALNWS